MSTAKPQVLRLQKPTPTDELKTILSLVQRTDYLSKAIVVTTCKSYSLLPYSSSAEIEIRIGTCKRENIYQVSINAPESHHYRGLAEVQRAINCRMPFSWELSESQADELQRCTTFLEEFFIPEMIRLVRPYRDQNYETAMVVANMEFKRGAKIRHSLCMEVDDPAWGRIFPKISEFSY